MTGTPVTHLIKSYSWGQKEDRRTTCIKMLPLYPKELIEQNACLFVKLEKFFCPLINENNFGPLRHLK